MRLDRCGARAAGLGRAGPASWAASVAIAASAVVGAIGIAGCRDGRVADAGAGPTATTGPAGPTMPTSISGSPDLSAADEARIDEVLAAAEGFAEPFARGEAVVAGRGPWTTAHGDPIGASATVVFAGPVDLPSSYEGVVPVGEDGEPVVGESVDERGVPLTRPYPAGELAAVRVVDVNIDLAAGRIHDLTPRG